MNGKILVLPGDGIGVEVTDQSLKILTAVSKKHNRSFTIEKDIVGGAAIDKYGKPLKSDTLNKALDSDAILFGAVGGPKWDDPTIDMRPEDSILTLRKELLIKQMCYKHLVYGEMLLRKLQKIILM